MKHKHKSLIVGLGQIGMGYDLELSNEKYILTHSSALHNNPLFDLVAGIDILDYNRRTFEKEFKKPTFNNIKTTSHISNIDIITISVPTEEHYNAVNDTLSFLSPKLVLLEKPISFSLSESRKTIKLCSDKNINVAVNYIREYEPIHRELFEKINKGKLGFPLKIVCWYSKGIMNNGSHFIQLLSNFMGDINGINVINRGRKLDNMDIEPALELSYERGEAFFLPLMDENFSIFEMEVFGPKGKIKYYNHGSHYELWDVSEDSIYPNYQKLKVKPIIKKTKMNKSQNHVYNNIAEFLEGKCNLFCDGKSALKTSEILDYIRESIIINE